MKLKYIALLLLILPALSACNQEDDVIDIFEGKTWKLSDVFFDKGSGNNRCRDYWDSEEAFNASEELRQKKGNFIINFTGAEVDGNVIGHYSGRAAGAISGDWQANGKNNSFKITSDQQAGNNMNVLERVYINGLINAYKYEGDTNGNLRIFFKDPDKKDNRFLLFHINNE